MRRLVVAALSTVLCLQGASAADVDWSAPAAVARIFREACIDGADRPAAVVDWGLANGFDPIDTLGGAADDLLGGEPGTVLAAPVKAGRVLLAGGAGRCTVWVEGVPGPPLRMAVAAMLSSVTAQGGRLLTDVDRPIERAGIWRSHQQWRLRSSAGTRELALAAVTTLNDAPGNQALNMTPLR